MTVTQNMCMWGPVHLQRERSGTGSRGDPQGAFRSRSHSREAFKRSCPSASEGRNHLEAAPYRREGSARPPINGYGRSSSERAAPVASPTIASSVRSTVTAAPPVAAPSSTSSAALHGAVGGLVLAVAAEPAVPVAVVSASASVGTAAIGAVPAASSPAVAAVAVVAAASFGKPVVIPVAGATATPTPSSSASPGGPGRAAAASSARLDVLLGHGLLDFHSVALDRVELDHGRLIGGVVVLEVDETEAALFPALFVGDDLGLLHGAELAEVLHQVPFAHVPFEAAHEEFLHLGVSAGLGRVLPGHGPLQLHRVPVHRVGGRGHGGVRLLHRRVGDEAEAPGALGLRVEHDHAVGEGAVGREVLPQPGLRGLHVQPTDEQLAQLRVLHAASGAAPGPGAETPPPVRGQLRRFFPLLLRLAASSPCEQRDLTAAAAAGGSCLGAARRLRSASPDRQHSRGVPGAAAPPERRAGVGANTGAHKMAAAASRERGRRLVPTQRGRREPRPPRLPPSPSQPKRAMLRRRPPLTFKGRGLSRD